jgi:hypothetical protein
MDKRIFNNVMNQHIVPFVAGLRTEHGLPPNEPALIVMDGSSTHFDLDFQELRDKFNIHILFFPPHSSHILQPLDLTVFGVLKQHLTQRFQYVEHEDARSRRTRLLRATMESLSIATARTYVMDGFIRAGLCPLNPDKPLARGLLIDKPKPLSKKSFAGLKRGLDMSGGRIVDDDKTTFPKPHKIRKISVDKENVAPNQPEWHLISTSDTTIRLLRR